MFSVLRLETNVLFLFSCVLSADIPSYKAQCLHKHPRDSIHILGINFAFRLHFLTTPRSLHIYRYKVHEFVSVISKFMFSREQI